MTVNPTNYVEWLLNLPPAKLTPRIREFMPALKTARLLDDLAYLAPDPDAIRRAAWRLWLAVFRSSIPTQRKDRFPRYSNLRDFRRSTPAAADDWSVGQRRQGNTAETVCTNGGRPPRRPAKGAREAPGASGGF